MVKAGLAEEPVFFFFFEFTPAVFVHLDSQFGVFSADEASKRINERLVVPNTNSPLFRCCFKISGGLVFSFWNRTFWNHA